MMKPLWLNIFALYICLPFEAVSQGSLRHGSLDKWIPIKFIFFGSKKQNHHNSKKTVFLSEFLQASDARSEAKIRSTRTMKMIAKRLVVILL